MIFTIEDIKRANDKLIMLGRNKMESYNLTTGVIGVDQIKDFNSFPVISFIVDNNIKFDINVEKSKAKKLLGKKFILKAEIIE